MERMEIRRGARSGLASPWIFLVTCQSRKGRRRHFPIVIDRLTEVVLPGNTFSVSSLFFSHFLCENLFFCLLAYISLRISWEVAGQETIGLLLADALYADG